MSSSSSGIYHISRENHLPPRFRHYASRPTFRSNDSSDYEVDPKCSCRIKWAYELHGLTQFLQSTTLRGRLFWGIILLICIVFAFTNFYLVFSEYLKSQTATLLTINQQRKLLFPSITFCPKNVDALNFTNIEKDIQARLQKVTEYMTYRLITVVLTGSGFNSMDGIDVKINLNREDLREAYAQWRGNRSENDMFELFFNTNGFKCQDLIKTCYYGSTTFNCCDWFEPVYVMLRGRCYQMKARYQDDEDEEGKLSFSIKRLESPYGDATGRQPQIVVYINNRVDEIAMSHRYYLSLNEWNRMRFRLRETKMLPGKAGCVQRKNGKGRSSCFVDTWHEKILHHFNCSLFYLSYKSPASPVCDPFLIAQNYQVLVNYSIEPLECLPSCMRYDYTVDLFTSELSTTKASDRELFHLEASYTDLQYERIEEVVTTTLPGFVSQIGGQFGLFLGISLMSLVQFCQSALIYTFTTIRTYIRLKFTLRCG